MIWIDTEQGVFYYRFSRLNQPQRAGSLSPAALTSLLSGIDNRPFARWKWWAGGRWGGLVSPNVKPWQAGSLPYEKAVGTARH